MPRSRAALSVSRTTLSSNPTALAVFPHPAEARANAQHASSTRIAIAAGRVPGGPGRASLPEVRRALRKVTLPRDGWRSAPARSA
jgi:hypothetical protein